MGEKTVQQIEMADLMVVVMAPTKDGGKGFHLGKKKNLVHG